MLLDSAYTKLTDPNWLKLRNYINFFNTQLNKLEKVANQPLRMSNVEDFAAFIQHNSSKCLYNLVYNNFENQKFGFLVYFLLIFVLVLVFNNSNNKQSDFNINLIHKLNN